MRRPAVLLLPPVFVGLLCLWGCQDLGPGQVSAMIQVIPPASQPAAKDADEVIRDKLTQILPKLEFGGIAVQDVIGWLRDVTNTNLYVKWGALSAVGIDKTNPVIVKLTDVTFAKALKTILDDVGGVHPLGYEVKDGVITISTKDDLARNTVTRLYEVRDLVSAEPATSSGEADGYELTGKLLEIIRSTVDRSSWVECSGTVGSSISYQGTLVVTQTGENHDQVRALLDSLRQGRYPQWELQLRGKLAQTRVRVAFQDIKLSHAFEALRTACGVNIVLDPTVGAKPAGPVTLKADSITLQQVLNLIARMEGLAWTVADGAIYVCRPQSALTAPPAPAPQASALPATQPARADPVLEANASQLKGTVVTAYLGAEMPKNKNVLWCGSFQLAWNELMDYGGGPVEVDNAPAMVPALNQRGFAKADMDDASVVALAGAVGEGVLAKAREELARKFPHFKPRLLPADGALPPGAVVMYACLIKYMPFAVPFARDSLYFGPVSCDPGPKVASFGMRGFPSGNARDQALAAQVRVIWHRFVADSGLNYPSEHFVVELLTKAQDDRLILALVPPKRTLAETVDSVLALMAKPNTKVLKRASSDEGALSAESGAVSHYACLLPEETLAVPVMDFDILRDFTELYDKTVKAKSPKLNGQPVLLAQQTIRFQLNENGAKLISEGAGIFGGAQERTRDFTFNRPFLVMLLHKGAARPYFAAWIANDELLAHEPPGASS